jgi:hypothetical protein
LKSIEKAIQGGRSEHLTWDLENFQICLISQTSNSKFIMIKASYEKVFNIKVFPLISPFQKVQNHPIWIKIEGLAHGSIVRGVLARFEFK